MPRLAVILVLLLSGFAFPSLLCADETREQRGGRAVAEPFEDFRGKWSLPQSELAEIAAGFLETLARRDDDFTRTYIRARFDERMLDHYTVDGLVEMFHSMQEMGDFELASIEKNGPGEATMQLVTGDGENMTLTVSAVGEPLRVMGFMLDDGVPDEGLAFESFDEMDATLAEMTGQNLFSGVVLVMDGGRELFRKAYGYANKENEIPVTTDTRFNVGSITKSFTKMAVTKLVREGKVELDAPIGTYVDGLHPSAAAKITVRHLLEMKGGMPEYFPEEAFRERCRELRELSDYLPIFADFEPTFEPGSRQAYSNTGYVLLGLVIESVTGEKYRDHVKKHVFDPAGMKDTNFHPVVTDDPIYAVGYMKGSSGYDRPGSALAAYRGVSAGGNFMTADDLYRFYQAIGSEKILSEKDYAFMQNGFEDGHPLVEGFYGIAGGSPMVSAVLEADTRTDFVVIVLANQSQPVAEDVARGIMRMRGES